MADNTEVIRSFLVSVGVQADEKGIKRLDQTVKSITKTVFQFAEAMGAAAVAAAAGVVKVSEQFDDLYYASQRLRSSVENIKAFGFGVSQMGGNAKAARESLEAFASFLRSNPAGEGVIRGMGVETRDAAGNVREYTDVLRDLGTQLRAMPYWAAQRRAAMLGIDENTLQALIRGTDTWTERYKKLVEDAGLDMDQMAKHATELMQSLRWLRAEIEIYFYKAMSKLTPEAQQLVVVLAAIGGALGVIAAILGPEVALVVALAGAFALLVDDFNGWREGMESAIDWSQWSDQIDAIVEAAGELWAALQELGVALEPFAKWFLGAFGPLISLAVQGIILLIHNLTGAIQIIADLLRGDWSKAWEDYKKGVTRQFDDIMKVWAKAKSFWNALWGHPDKPAAPTGPSAQARATAKGGANDNKAPVTTPATRGAIGEAMAYFERQGWTKAQAAGIVANLQKESTMNPRAVGDGGSAYGVAQWHEDRQAAFRAWSGKDIRESTLADQLAFVNYELTRGKERPAGDALRNTSNAYEAGAVVSRRYERPAQRDAEAHERGNSATALLGGQRLGTDGAGRTVTINAKTDIKVTGTDSPKETAKAVGNATDRSNSNLVRNTQTAVR